MMHIRSTTIHTWANFKLSNCKIPLSQVIHERHWSPLHQCSWDHFCATHLSSVRWADVFFQSPWLLKRTAATRVVTSMGHNSTRGYFRSPDVDTWLRLMAADEDDDFAEFLAKVNEIGMYYSGDCLQPLSLGLVYSIYRRVVHVCTVFCYIWR